MFLPILTENEVELEEEGDEEEEEGQHIVQKILQVKRMGNYVYITINRYRMKFVLLERSKSIVN